MLSKGSSVGNLANGVSVDKGKILESWKEIAAHLHRNIRTCQMWERDLDLPIHRLDGSPKARVFAYADELDRWLEEKLHEGENPDAEAGLGPGIGKPGIFRGTILGIRKTYAFSGFAFLAVLIAGWLIFKPGASTKVYDSIAVLPLEILSKEPGQDYYSEGLAEELITRLFQVGSLRVAEFGPVRDYRTSKKTYKDIRRNLDVKAILDSAVLRVGDRIRINVKLVDAETERPIWANSYERDFADVLAIQAEISQAIVREVRVRLTPQERNRIASSPKVVPAAYEAFLKGNQLLQALFPTEEQSKQTQTYLRQAINIDPEFAPFYWKLVEFYKWQLMASLMPYEEAIARAEQALKKGLELDPDSSQAHLSSGAVAWLKWEWEKAQEEFKLAIELSPGDPANYSGYTNVLHGLGRFEESIASARKMVEVDVSHSIGHKLCLVGNLQDAKRFDEAISICREVIKLSPDDPVVHDIFAWALASAGRMEEAVEEAVRSQALLPADEPGSIHVNNAVVFAWAGRRGMALEILNKYLAYKKGKPVDSATIAGIYARLNDKEEAFKWIERALDEHSFYIIWLKVDLSIESLRSDPRFEGYLKRAGFK